MQWFANMQAGDPPRPQPNSTTLPQSRLADQSVARAAQLLGIGRGKDSLATALLLLPPEVRVASQIAVDGGLMDGVPPTPLAASTDCTPRVHRRAFILPDGLVHQLLLGERQMLARRR